MREEKEVVPCETVEEILADDRVRAPELEADMRPYSIKSLCILAGLLVPVCGATSPAQAGVIPWLYDSIFGYGWGGQGYGYGYGGATPYSVGYGGYNGYGGYGYGYSSPVYAAPTYSTPVYSAPAVTSPGALPPADGTYNAHYGPVIGYYGYTAAYGPAWGSCCDPCNACSTGNCSTPVETGKPATPTPLNEEVPVTPKKQKGLPNDDMEPRRDRGAGGSVGTDEVMPESENVPNRSRNSVDPDTMEAPLEEGGTEEGLPAGTKESYQPLSTDRNITSRQVPAPRRLRLPVPKSVARVVRVDRSVREQLVSSPVPSQLAANK